MTPPGKIRIIGGKWKNRKIEVKQEAIRPTSDRVRETLFNWLAPVMTGSLCLDLFAGTGALGIESLSRGAKHVTFVEKDFEAACDLKLMLQKLNATSFGLVRDDALAWLYHTVPVNPFDIIFIDPPFHQKFIEPLFDALCEKAWTKPNTLIYVETEKNLEIYPPPHWTLYREGETKEVSYRLYQVGAATI